MPDTDLNKSTTTNLDSEVSTFSVGAAHVDSAQGDFVVWDNRNFHTNLGYYKSIPEFKKAVDALATWTVGKGFTSEGDLEILENISGNGKQSFQTIMEGHMVMKKVNGDSYIEIIRNEQGTLVNLKLLNPARMKTFFTNKGLVDHYEQTDVGSNKTIRTFKPTDILHSMNEIIADEIHGTSALEACKWVIDARNEAMSDWRRISHRSTIRVMYVDIDDTTKLNTIKDQYKTAIDKGELMIIPAKRSEAEFEQMVLPPIDAFMQWIRYLEDFFYKAVGIPRIILGGAQEHTEASAKVGYITFEPVYTQEQQELEADLWNQVALKVKFNRPAELGGLVQEEEQKNTGQLGIQPNETAVQTQRTE